MDLSARSASDASPAPASVGGGAAAALDEQVALLRELTTLCMEVARVTGRQVLAAAEAAAQAASLPPSYVAPPYSAQAAEPVVHAHAQALGGAVSVTPMRQGEAHLAFHRAARAVRTSVALWRQLEREKELDAAAEAQAALEARRAEVEARRAEAAERRLRAGRVVERAAHDHFEIALPGEAKDAEAALAARDACREAAERLADEDLYPDLAETPLSEIVARICRDVGVKPNWRALAEERWAQAEMDAADAGRPSGAALAARAQERRGRGPQALTVHFGEPPRLNSRRWRRRHADGDDPAPTPPPRTIQVSFVEADPNGGPPIMTPYDPSSYTRGEVSTQGGKPYVPKTKNPSPWMGEGQG